MTRLSPVLVPRAAAIAVLIALGLTALAAAEDGGVPGSIIGREEPAYERGTHLLRTGDVEGAVAELARAIEIAPNNPRVLARYAQALIVTGDANASIQALERLRELDPGAPGLNYFLGLASYQSGDWSAARDHLLVANADDPDNALTQLFLAVAYYELGEYDAAGRALDAAERLDPALGGQVAYRRGLLHFAESRFAEAQRAFESVQARQPGSPLARSATSYLARLKRLRPQPWDLYGTFGLGYDSNLSFSSDSDPSIPSGIDSGRLIAEMGSSYLFGNDRRSLTVGQTLYGHIYPDDVERGTPPLAPNEFSQQISRTWAQAHAELAGPVSIDARYTFEFVWTDWRQFRQTNAVEPGLSFTIGSRMVSRAYFRWEVRSFQYEVAPGNEDFNRDGEVTRGGGDLSFVLPSGWFWGSSFARVGYSIRREDADGKEYDAYGHEPVITLTLALPRSVLLTLDGRVEWRAYENRSRFQAMGAGNREDVIGQLRAIIQRPFGDHVAAELSYGYINRSSNADAFEYKRHELSVLATYRY